MAIALNDLCPTGKAQHSYSAAKAKAKKASRRTERPMTAYRCPDCGAWHVGSHTHKPQPMRWVNNNHQMRLT